jgi:hypothetical protein
MCDFFELPAKGESTETHGKLPNENRQFCWGHFFTGFFRDGTPIFISMVRGEIAGPSISAINQASLESKPG